MNKLWFIFVPAILLSFLVPNRSKSIGDDGKKKGTFFIVLITILLILFCGLRTFYNDTVTYSMMYGLLGNVKQYVLNKQYSFSSGWGFGLVGSFLKQIGFLFQDFLLFFAVVTVTPYVIFVRKYCENFAFGMFLMFTTGMYTFALAGMKQAAAMAIAILFFQYAAERKWFIFFLGIGLASLFHPYAVIYLIVPFMVFKPFTQKTYFYIVLFVIAGFCLDSLLGTILNVTDMMGANYDESSFTGEGVNIFRVLVSFVPLVLGVMYRHTLFDDSSDSENLMFNLAMLNALIMFVGLFGTANYFARLANFFLPAQVAVIPWILDKVDEDSGKIMKPIAVAGYTGYFMYDNIIRHVFDYGYLHTSLSEYLKRFF